jgi:hypothetical protein
VLREIGAALDSLVAEIGAGVDGWLHAPPVFGEPSAPAPPAY